MQENGASFRMNQRERLLIPSNSDSNPQITLPGTLVAHGGLVVAKDLAAVPPPLVAIAREKRIRSMTLPPDEVKSFYFSLPDALVKGLTQTETSPAPKFMLLTGIEDTTSHVLGSLGRQVQRTEQFKRLIDLTDRLEMQRDDLPETVSPRAIDTLRKVAHTWYRDELAEEPLTRGIAEGILTTNNPSPDTVVAAAEKYLTAPEPPKSKDYILEWLTSTSDAREKAKKDLENLKKREEKSGANSQGSEKIAEIARDIRDGAREAAKEQDVRASGVLYVHDNVKDEPSEEAGNYVRELMNRPF